MLFRTVWFIDFEFVAAPGERPRPFCLSARGLQTGREIRLWEQELRGRRAAPFDTGADSLIVAFYASAEISCIIDLGWPTPVNILDLFNEFRNFTNGQPVPCG